MIGLDLGFWQNHNAPSFDPLSLSPALWLDASDSATLFQSNGGAAASADGDPVGYWLDKSGNGRHLTQTSGINKPLLKLAIKNGKNGVLFNGTSSYFTMSNYTHGSSMTCFRVFERPTSGKRNFTFTNTTAQDTPFLWDSNNKVYVGYGTLYFEATSANTNSGYFIARSSYTSTSDLACWLNNVAVSGSLSGTPSSALPWYRYCNTVSLYSLGNVLEDIVFPSALSADNIINMNTYLNTKWALY